MKATDRILPLLSVVRPRGENRWLALCPAHPDKNPSLSILQADDRVLLKCWTGCTATDVVTAVGLELGDLFDSQRRQPKPDPIAQRKLQAVQRLEKWRQAEIRRCAQDLRIRDLVIRSIDAAVASGFVREEETYETLEHEYSGYSELEFQFNQLLRKENVLELWRARRTA